MRAIVTQHLVVAVTAFLLGCSDSPTEVSGSTQPTPLSPDQPIHRLIVTPSTVTISAGTAVRLTAMDGLDVVLLPSAVSWTSLNTEIATVGQDGVVRGRSPGRGQVEARWNTSRAVVQIAVTKAVPDGGGKR